jgi:glycosyltransferase involved in cell wall biosynthesis
MSVSKLNEQLNEAGCYTEMFTTTANGNTELPVVPGEQVMVDNVPVTYFKRLTKDHSHFSPALLKRLWKEARNFDVIHIHAWWNTVSVLSCLVALLRRVPVVISPRGMLSPYSFANRNNRYKRVIHRLLGRTLISRSHIHTTSAYESESIKTLIHPKSLHELPNLVTIGAVPSYTKPISDKELRFIFFSRIEEKKGLDLLLDALPGLNEPYHLTIAGDGAPAYIARLKQQASRLQLDTHITWLGFQSVNKFSILSEHDLLILPSHDENFANVVIESLSVGTPVLVSKYVGLADYVLENDFGWIWDPKQTSLTAFVRDIIQQRTKFQNIRTTAPEKIHKDFNDIYLARKYVNMYTKIIHEGI